MATINKFEQLVCWQKARELTREIYQVTESQSLNVSEFNKFKGDRGLKDQIQRAAVSIMSNVAEGFERGTRQELLNYLFIAKGSAGEVRTQLYAALDAGYLNFETFKCLNQMAQDCSALISRFIQSIKVSQFKGLQYKTLKKPRQMDSVTKLLLDQSPKLRKYYNPEKLEIEWWRKARDEEAKRAETKDQPGEI